VAKLILSLGFQSPSFATAVGPNSANLKIKAEDNKLFRLLIVLVLLRNMDGRVITCRPDG